MYTRLFSLVFSLLCCWNACNAKDLPVDATPNLSDLPTDSEARFAFRITPTTAGPVTVNCGAKATTNAVWQNPKYPKEDEGLPGLCLLTLTPPAGTCGLKIHFADLAFSQDLKRKFTFVMSYKEGVTEDYFGSDLSSYEGYLAMDSNDTDPKLLLLQLDPKVAFKFRINVTLVACNSIKEYKSPSICGIKNGVHIPNGRSDLPSYELDEEKGPDNHDSRRDSVLISRQASHLRRKESTEKLGKPDNKRIPQAAEDGKVKVNPNQKIYPVDAAEIGEWPWMVPLGKKPKETESFFATESHCTGVLLDDKHVLTPFSCIGTTKLSEIRALLGEHDVSVADETLPINASIAKVSFPVTRNVKMKKHDVAILTLETPVEFTRNIRPICLPVDYNIYSNDDALVMGWPYGFDSRHDYHFVSSSALLSSEVQLTNETYCQSILERRSSDLDPDDFMCALPNVSSDLCNVSDLEANAIAISMTPNNNLMVDIGYYDRVQLDLSHVVSQQRSHSHKLLDKDKLELIAAKIESTPLVRRAQTGAHFLEGVKVVSSPLCDSPHNPTIYNRVDKMSDFLNLALA